MKRTGNLFEKIFSRENLYQAFLSARSGKRNKRACYEFEKSIGFNLDQLYEELHSGSYHPAPYFTFDVYEPKKRTIHSPAFRDCVVQHAIYRVIYDLFDRTFIDSSFACRTGKGTHKASDYTQSALRACDGHSYTLSLDIRKFFYRIDRGILRKQIERKIKDARLVDVMMLFVEHDAEVGIPIGNLLSQLYALIYLNPLDHFIKRGLRIRHYVRYVDDFILIGLTREQCLDYRSRIVEFIKNELRLELSRSTIQKVKRGLNFVGYRTWRACRFIRKHSLYKFNRAVRDSNLARAVSLLGHSKNTRSLFSMLDRVKEKNDGLYRSLPKSYRRIHNPSFAVPL